MGPFSSKAETQVTIINYFYSLLIYETIMRTGITCTKTPFTKIYWIQHAFEVEWNAL